ncbi:AEC family transporter [Clostridium sp. Marseille-P2415]|uniref:AEC family transporter n=1 Tax=Clostridium sp. Marseille-P2415 TaxID=1805471 RepID=UPI00098831B6|nr:AEC family transporter [Clostridium sp. Marseille-P2415]
MQTVLLKAGSFVLIILAGYILKKAGLFQPGENRTIMKLILNVTLPAAVITSFANYERDMALLSVFFLGFILNVLMAAVGYLAAGKQDRAGKAFNMINYSGYNIGTFAMPYLQSFLGNMGTVVACLFDSGNAVMCTGVTFAVASSVAGEKNGQGMAGFMKKLFHSVPFVTYLFMILFYVADFRFPAPVYTVTSAFAGGNAFLAMFMIGGALEFSRDRKKLRSVMKVLAVRYGTAVCLAAAFRYFLPFSPEIKRILMIIVFAPITSMGVINTERLNGDMERAGMINSMSILISLAVMTGLVSFWKLGV